MNSREKGKRGERQWRDELRANGYCARRGQQFCGSAESPDVVCDELPWIHFEVKAVERLNIEEAMEQARADAAKSEVGNGKKGLLSPTLSSRGGEGENARALKVPIVAHRRNFCAWLVTMEAKTFFDFLRGTLPLERNEQTETEQKEDPKLSMLLQCKESSKPHPEGIHPAVCVDVIDLGLVEVEFQGQRRMVNKVKVMFETEQKGEDGKNCTVSKNFTASLHPKAKLSEFLGKWRGRPVVPGETIDLAKLIGACCTLVISHQQNLVGRTYGSIDAISKPSKKVAPSGQYDPVDMRRRIVEAAARQGGMNGTNRTDRSNSVERNGGGTLGSAGVSVPGGGRPPAPTESAKAAVPKSEAAPVAAAPAYDPEVGF